MKVVTEYEVLYLLNETSDRIWALIQYWTSVSFGYLILAHVAAPRLNLLIIVVLSILYAAFSVQMLEVFFVEGGLSLAYIESLTELSKTVGLHSPAALHAVESKADFTGAIVSIFGTFSAALLYLPYSYYRAKREHT